MAIAWSGSGPFLRAADFVAPIGALWVNAIRMTVIPLVVALLVSGVASAADVQSIGRLGSRTLAVFIAMLAVHALVAIPLTALVFGFMPERGPSLPPLPAGAEEAAKLVAGGPATSFGDWLVSLVPPNPIASAASGAMLPLMIFTFLFALAATRSAPATRATIVSLSRAVGEVMMTLVRWVILAAPIGVFALMLPLAARAGAGLAGAIGFYIIAYSILSVLAILITYPVVAVVGRVPMRRFARAALPAQLIAFTSSSSVASLPALVESAERALGLSKRISGFVLPLAVSTFKYAGPVTWTVGAMFVGWFYGIPLGARELSLVGVACVFLAAAAPGVPRGGFIILAPLFSAIGLPIEGIGILIALDVIPDTFATALNVTGDLVAATLVARFEPGAEPEARG